MKDGTNQDTDATSTRNEGFERLDGFLLNAVPDEQDLRDYPYEPALVQLKRHILPPSTRTVLNQGSEGACTGFGLAAVINHLLAERGEARAVSARMLYEMAKKFDEWEGEGYSGSSCRGAVRGWNNMGVCSDSLAPYHDGQAGWQLTIGQAKDARVTTLGAYYRVNKRISHYHAALNEVGVLYASAYVHKGWQNSSIVDGTIPHQNDRLGGHAFAIVGYDDNGFYVQNSWGSAWGDRGVALWLYEDWLENVGDAWALRLALSTPQIWHLGPSASEDEDETERLFPAGLTALRSPVILCILTMATLTTRGTIGPTSRPCERPPSLWPRVGITIIYSSTLTAVSTALTRPLGGSRQ